eukprot:CAMPEP_0117663750 /NCGR_PEP_ID=MMETSP0804-20121206/8792_1 /TAXON_ID=1074897 /ORGANISM="Tetraselmis astigmatica, Strain CCMP880" /LENGTH=108 /DNA_ID=CAMNT_0005470815 /DNA_START=76 /DNA_END=402 /DNA_ORIENTATION=+
MGAEKVRLYVPAKVTGYKGSTTSQHSHTSLIKIDGVVCKEHAEFYLGKKIAYIYKAKTQKKGTYYRCVWGKVNRAHGSGGTVRAKFRKNLPPSALGATCRVMLYPSNI